MTYCVAYVVRRESLGCLYYPRRSRANRSTLGKLGFCEALGGYSVVGERKSGEYSGSNRM